MADTVDEAADELAATALAIKAENERLRAALRKIRSMAGFGRVTENNLNKICDTVDEALSQ